MSGVVKGIKKTFKKVAKFVKKNFAEIALAAAVVYTGGLALGAWGGAAGAAGAAGAGAGMTTGQLAAAGALPSAAGAGAAAGGASLGAFAPAAGFAGTGTLTAATQATLLGGGVAGSGLGAAAGVGGTMSFSSAAASLAKVGASTATGGGGFFSKAAGGLKNMWSGMSGFEKATVLKTGVDMAAGFLAPTRPPAARQIFGRNSKGEGPGMGFDFDPNAGADAPFKPGKQGEFVQGAPQQQAIQQESLAGSPPPFFGRSGG